MEQNYIDIHILDALRSWKSQVRAAQGIRNTAWGCPHELTIAMSMPGPSLAFLGIFARFPATYGVREVTSFPTLLKQQQVLIDRARFALKKNGKTRGGTKSKSRFRRKQRRGARRLVTGRVALRRPAECRD